MRMLTLVLAVLALSAFVGCQSKPMVLSESGSGSEGIKVHGDWTVEVTNPDGSLATRRQFSNSITTEGFGILAALMTHDQPIVSRRILILMSNTEVGFDASDIYCNDAGEEEFFRLSPKAVSVISADKKGSIWSVGCTVSIENDSKTAWIYQINGKLSLEGGDTYKGWMDFSNESIEYPSGIEVVDGQYISATVVYSFN